MLLSGPAVLAGPETVDRVVASIANQAITLSEVEAEYRLELFLDGRVAGAVPDAPTLARVCNRLIEQKLLAEEAIAEEPETGDPPHDVRPELDALRKKFPTEDAYRTALGALGLDEQQLIERLAQQEKALEIIDRRFRPSAWPEQAEVETYYRETFLPEYARQNAATPPPLAAVEEQIREILIQRNINRLLDEWLAEMKASRRVRVHGF